MLCSLGLMMTNRAWTVTKVTLLSFVVNGTLNFLLLRPALRAWGEGGAGIGAASIWVGTELLVALTYVWFLGRDVLDRRNVVAFGKSLVASACVVAVHLSTASLGPLRLVIDLVVYVVLILGSGAVPVSELSGLVAFARENVRRRRAG
jgi:O-antigen/teichoic acid export membrane protein